MKNLNIGLILICIIPLLLGIGWMKNLIKFIHLDFKAPYKAEIIRGISLSPIGTITGWINIEDK
jgi:hypothetical protein